MEPQDIYQTASEAMTQEQYEEMAKNHPDAEVRALAEQALLALYQYLDTR